MSLELVSPDTARTVEVPPGKTTTAATTDTDHAACGTADPAEHDPVHHPSHYTNHPSGIEHIEVSEWFGFALGNAIKYVWRRGDKGTPAQDLDKSLFYLDRSAAHPRERSDADGGRAGGWWSCLAAAFHLRRNRAGRSTACSLRFTPPTAAELLLCVADHETDPVAADFYRAVAAMDWDGARDAVLGLRSAFPA